MKPKFLPNGDYDLSTVELRLAAAEAELRNIATIPIAHFANGAEWCRDEMARRAGCIVGRLARCSSEPATTGSIH